MMPLLTVRPSHLAEHVLLAAEDGSCEAPCLLQLAQVDDMVPQRNTQARPAAASPCVGTVGQVVEWKVTSNRYIQE